MSIERDKLAAQLRYTQAMIESLIADVEREAPESIRYPDQVSDEFADDIAIRSAGVADNLLDGLSDLITGDQFQGVEDELASLMKAQIDDFIEANTPTHVEVPVGATYRAKELGVGAYR